MIYDQLAYFQVFFSSCLVVGTSRGLGAALVERLLNLGFTPIIGISRTGIEHLRQYDWARSDRYRHVELDVSSQDAAERLHDVVAELPPGPLLVIYNAASVKSDIRADGRLDFGVFKEVNEVGVTGLGHVLQAVEGHLLGHGGTFVGISSYAALAPPVRAARIAYPASKAYLDMALRSLRHAWRGRARVVIAHLGHIGGSEKGTFSRWICPSYATTAHRILKALTSERVTEEINYTFPYAIVYKYLLPFLPESLYFFLFSKAFGRREDQGSLANPST